MVSNFVSPIRTKTLSTGLTYEEAIAIRKEKRAELKRKYLEKKRILKAELKAEVLSTLYRSIYLT